MRADQSAYLDTPPLALAHRGGAEYPPNRGLENTMTAFRNAVALGYTYLETDVHATSDGAVVAFHDEHLDRVSDRTGAIAELPWSEVSQARVGDGGHIPLLDELLTEFPTTRLNIDIKAPGAIEPLWRLIERHAAYDRVCIGSFSNARLWRFRRLAREHRVTTAGGPLGTAALRLLPWVVTRFLHTPGAVFQVPVHQPFPLGISIRVVTLAFVERAHRLGKQVHVWTIDDPAEMNELLDLGVDGLVTDRPDLLLKVLQARRG